MLPLLLQGLGVVLAQATSSSPLLQAEEASGQTAVRPPAAFFVENAGQWPDEVAMALRGSGRDLTLGADGWSWTLWRAGDAPDATADNHPAGDQVAWLDEEERVMAPAADWARVTLRPLVGAPLHPQAVGPGAPVRWLRGSEEARARTAAEVLCPSVWPGVDLRFLTHADGVKHQFELAAGADPATVRLAIDGADARLDDDGALVLTTPLGTVRDAAPLAWQDIDGQRQPVAVRYALERADRGAQSWTLGFEVGAHDPSLPLVLDPDTLIYCGYIGGSDFDELRGIEVTADGTIFVAGHTASPDLPVRGAFQGSYGGGDFDVFVAGVDQDGVLIYLTYLGGSSRELAYDLSLDPAGNIYVAGGTASDDFPVLVGPYLTRAANLDGFVTKIDPTGALVYSGYLGGDQFDSIRGNEADAAGNHYVIGRSLTDDGTFPVEVGPDLTHNGGFSDVFVAKINPAGDDVIYCGFIGGDEIDYGRDVAIDAQGFAYYCGWTNSREDTFPVVGGPDLTYNGGEENWGASFPQYGDGFLAKVLPDGSGFASCGYVGGAGADAVFGVRVDAFGAVYVGGHTTSDETTLPVRFGPDLTYNGAPPNEPYGDMLVGKLKASFSGWDWLGYVGGDNQDRAWRMDRGPLGRIYLVGNTRSQRDTFPHQSTGPRIDHGGDEDAFLSAVAANGGRILYSTYFAGTARETARDVAVDDEGFVHVAGWTRSPTFPLVVGPELTPQGDQDGFVSRVLPYHYLLRAGNAIDPNTVERVDLLTVNGEVGDNYKRRVFVQSGGGPVTIDVQALGYDGKPLPEADFVLYLWNNEPESRLATHIETPRGEAIGTAVFPTPLGAGTSDIEGLTTLINTTGRYRLLGRPLDPRTKPAPTSLDLELPGPGKYTVQALIEDPNKASGATLSNAVVIIVQQ